MDGEVMQIENLGTKMGKINVGKAGIKIDADDGLKKVRSFSRQGVRGLQSIPSAETAAVVIK